MCATNPHLTLSSVIPSADFTSETASVAFVRRTLCPHHQTKHARKAATAGRPGKEFRQSSQLSATKNDTTLSDLPLPPLTSSNEVDVHLYAILATLVKEFLVPWYPFGSFKQNSSADAYTATKLGPRSSDAIHGTGCATERDEDTDELIKEIVRVVAHCSRGVEERLRRVDFEKMLLDDLPALVERHVDAYRTAHSPRYSQKFTSSPQHIYHTLNPHPALSPCSTLSGLLIAQNSTSVFPEPTSKPGNCDVRVRDLYPSNYDPTRSDPPDASSDSSSYTYCYLLAEGVLAVLLPPEELANTCLRTLLTDVLAELVLCKCVGVVASEPRFLWDSIARLAGMAGDHLGAYAENSPYTDIEGKYSTERNKTGTEKDEPTKKPGPKMTMSGRLEKFGLLDPVGLVENDDISEECNGNSGLIRNKLNTWFGYVAFFLWTCFSAGYMLFVVTRVLARIYLSTSYASRSGKRKRNPVVESDSRSYNFPSASKTSAPDCGSLNAYDKNIDVKANSRLLDIPVTIKDEPTPEEVNIADRNKDLVDVEGGRVAYASADCDCSVPYIAMKIWPCIGHLLDIPMVMPWLSGFAAWAQWVALNGPGRLGKLDGFIDR